MATVQHSTLTGSSLHEPKGVAAAAANKVYVSDGAASGAWQKLTASQLTGTGNAFGAQLLHVRDERAAGTAGTSTTAGAFRTITLNTVKTNEISGVTLSGNQILSVPAGTYWCDGMFYCGPISNASHKSRLYNVTDGATLVTGMTKQGDTDGAALSSVGEGFFHLRQRFTLTGTKTIELQAYLKSTATPSASNVGELEVYADLSIWKIA